MVRLEEQVVLDCSSLTLNIGVCAYQKKLSPLGTGNNPDDVLISASCSESINFDCSDANIFSFLEFPPLSKKRLSSGKLDEDSFVQAVENAQK